jgi:hypothetical protein
MTNSHPNTRRLLWLVSTRESTEGSEVLEHIKPLPDDVLPSSRFLEETRGRLLRTMVSGNGRGLAA